jgi:hypothetical protein
MGEKWHSTSYLGAQSTGEVFTLPTKKIRKNSNFGPNKIHAV